MIRIIRFSMFMMALTMAGNAWAAYGSVPQNTEVNPEVMRIDEKTFLGEKVSGHYQLIDQDGQQFALGDLFGQKPTILALSYYKCDGACSVLNRNLWNTLQEVKQWKINRDFNVVTISFDQHDNPESLAKFMQEAGFGDGLPEGWRITTMVKPEEIMQLTGSVGYKFFWSPRDAMFLHPNVYIMISPKGRVTRYLYGANISGRDMEVSITKAMGEELSAANVINFIVGACYSYNYKDGKYTINIPIFIAAGALLFGLSLIFGSFWHMKRRRAREDRVRDARLAANESDG